MGGGNVTMPNVAEEEGKTGPLRTFGWGAFTLSPWRAIWQHLIKVEICTPKDPRLTNPLSGESPRVTLV